MIEIFINLEIREKEKQGKDGTIFFKWQNIEFEANHINDRLSWNSHCGSAIINPTSIYEDRVGSLASLSGLRIQRYCEL